MTKGEGGELLATGYLGVRGSGGWDGGAAFGALGGGGAEVVAAVCAEAATVPGSAGSLAEGCDHEGCQADEEEEPVRYYSLVGHALRWRRVRPRG